MSPSSHSQPSSTVPSQSSSTPLQTSSPGGSAPVQAPQALEDAPAGDPGAAEGGDDVLQVVGLVQDDVLGGGEHQRPLVVAHLRAQEEIGQQQVVVDDEQARPGR